MTEAWKQWEGQVVEGKFPLRKYLGGSERGAVFLTEYSDGQAQKAAIKLVRADSSQAEAQLALWQLAAKLSHPNLLKVFQAGRCQMAKADMLFVVMEYADENLSQILPERPLTPNEARDMLEPILDGLVYLHAKGFVHGHIKPANILASGDELKLSSDDLCRGEMPGGKREESGPYDAPETADGVVSPSSDAWSLGMTLVEALTQHLPAWQPSQKTDPAVPESLPAPFLEIARSSLRRDAKRRSTIGEIAARLNPSSAAAAAAAAAASSAFSLPARVTPLAGTAVDPLSVPLSPVPPVSQARNLPGPAERYGPPDPMARWRLAPKKSPSFVSVVAIALVLAAILIVPKLLNHRPQPQQPPAAAAAQAPAQQTVQRTVQPPAKTKAQTKQEQQPAPVETKAPSPATPSDTEGALKATAEKERASTGEPPSPTSAESQPAAKGSPASGKGEVLDQVLPDVSEKAQQTIQGKVRVNVRVHVDPSGAVTQAELDAPAASQYFADLSVQAARRWAFSPPEVEGRSVASEWILRFEYTQSGPKVVPAQVSP